MNVLISINGREAIPVRAIPLLTTWDQLGAGMIARALSGDDHLYPDFVGLIAHRFEDQQVKDIPATYWKNVVEIELRVLHEKVTRDHHGLGPAATAAWRKSHGAMAVLPPGAFVWRSEFEERFWKWCGPKGERVWVMGPGRTVAVPVPRGESIVLDFDPFMPDVDLRNLVMEGFEECAVVRLPQEDGSRGSQRDTSDSGTAFKSEACSKARPQVPLVQPSEAGQPEVADLVRETNWQVKKPKRDGGYRAALYKYLVGVRNDGGPVPTAATLTAAWMKNKPLDIEEVLPDGIKYQDGNGTVHLADLDAIRKAIGRMVL